MIPIRSLFLKILLWFWLTFTMVVVTMVVVTVTILGREINSESHAKLTLFLPLESRRATEIYEKDGAAGLKLHFDQLEATGIVRPYFFNEHGQEIFGRTPPGEAAKFAQKAKADGEPIIGRILWHTLGAQRFVGPGGRSYTMMVILTKSTLVRFFRAPDPKISLILLAVLLVGGAFCFWLARHIAQPVEALSKTADRIAAGDLDARANQDLYRRKDEIGKLGRNFDRMAGQIESLVRGQQRLLRDVSHELRSPLTRLSLAEALLRRSPEEEREEYLNRIELEVEHIDQLIGQLLTLARAESGADASRKERIDLGTLLQEVAADGNFEAQPMGRTVRVNALETCFVAGAGEQLRRALENVVRNAVRHTKPNTEVEITLSRQSKSLPCAAVIQVQDHGPGVAEKHLEKIFLPFYRVPATPSDEGAGSGLGLAITDRIIRMHGGNVRAEAAVNGGLVVRLELPLME